MPTVDQLRARNRAQMSKSGAGLSQMFRGLGKAAQDYFNYKEAEKAAQGSPDKESPMDKEMRGIITEQAKQAANQGNLELLQDLEPQLIRYYGSEGAQHFKTMAEKHYNPADKAAMDFQKMLTSVLYPEQMQQKQTPQEMIAGDENIAVDMSGMAQPPSEAQMTYDQRQKQVFNKINSLMTDDFKSRQLVKFLTGSDPGPHALTVQSWLSDYADDREKNPNKPVAQSINDTAIKYSGFVPSEVQNFRDIDPEDNKELSQMYANTLLGSADFLMYSQKMHPDKDIGTAAHIEVMNRLVDENKPLPEKYQQLHDIVSGFNDIVMEQRGTEIRNEEFSKAMGVEAAKRTTFPGELQRELTTDRAKARQEMEIAELQAEREYRVSQITGRTRIGESTAKSLAGNITLMNSSSSLAQDIVSAVSDPEGKVDLSKIPVGPFGRGFAIHLASKWGIKPNKLQANIRAQLAAMVKSAYETTGANTTKIEMEKIIDPTVAAINESPQHFINKYSEFQRKYRDEITNHLDALKAANKDLGGYDTKVYEAAKNMNILDEMIKPVSKKEAEATLIQSESTGSLSQEIISQWKANPGKPITDGTYIYFKHPEQGWVVSKIPGK